MTTKKTALEKLDEAINPPTPELTADEKALERADKLALERSWARERALDNALTLHKQNGGMTLPERIIEDAQKFLNFVQG